MSSRKCIQVLIIIIHRCKTNIIISYDMVSNEKALSNKKYQGGLAQAQF